MLEVDSQTEAFAKLDAEFHKYDAETTAFEREADARAIDHRAS